MVKCTQSLFTKIAHSGIIILNFSMLEFGTERQIHKMFFFKQQFWDTDIHIIYLWICGF